jgi:hypothetical protein
MTPDLKDAILRWQNDPVLFVQEALGCNPSVRAENRITNQQANALRELRNTVFSKMKFYESQYHGTPIDDEEKRYAFLRGLSIRSANGLGKDALSSWAALWFIFCFEHSRVQCTAPTGKNIKINLWNEMQKWLNMRTPDGVYASPIRELFEVEADTIYLKEVGKSEQFIVWKTSADEAGSGENQALAGFHAPYTLTIVDEANAVSDNVFKPLESTQTDKCNVTILIWNPVIRSGYAYNTHFGKEWEQWIRPHWDAEKSDRPGLKIAIANAEAKYGRDSNYFRIHVNGLPPEAEEGTLIPFEWIYRAVGRELPPNPRAPYVLGIDVAGQGTNKSVIVVRKGGIVYDIKKYRQLSQTELAGWILKAINELDPEAVCIDIAGGIGAGIMERILEHFPRVHGINGVSAAWSPEKFYNLRSELHWILREQFERNLISIPDDADLISQLSAVRYIPDPKGRVRVELKTDLMKRLKLNESPDEMDSLMYSFFISDKIAERERDRDAYWAAFKRHEQDELGSSDNRLGWMRS